MEISGDKHRTIIPKKKILFQRDLNSSRSLKTMRELGVLPLCNSSTKDQVSFEAVKKQKTFSYAPVTSFESLFQHPVYNEITFTNSLSEMQPESPTGHDLFVTLPDEVVLRILHYLPKKSLSVCSKVCKRWRNLCLDNSLWKYLMIVKTRIYPGGLEQVFRRGAIALNLFSCEIQRPVFLPRFSFSRCRLEYLNLSLTKVSILDFCSIFSICHSLKNVSLENCTINEAVCSSLAANSNLEVLNMALVKGLTEGGISELCLCCLKLKSWNLGWSGLKEDSLKVLAEVAPSTLERLNISGCKGELNNETLAAIMKRCSKLVELDVSDCALLTCVTIHNVIQMLPLMEHIWFCRCSSINPRAYLLLKKLKSLQQLEIFGNVQDAGLSTIKTLLKSVKVNEQYCSTIARPTTGAKRTSIWNVAVQDCQFLLGSIRYINAKLL